MNLRWFLWRLRHRCYCHRSMDVVGSVLPIIVICAEIIAGGVVAAELEKLRVNHVQYRTTNQMCRLSVWA